MLVIITGILVGLALGLTGGGGSLFAVPLLIYLLDIEPRSATTISLAAVSVIAALGAFEAGLKKMIEWRASLIFIIGGIICAPLGVKIAGFLNDREIMVGFAVLMFLISISMLYRAYKKPDQAGIVRANYSGGAIGDGAVCQLNDNQQIRLSAPCSAVLIITGSLTGVLSGLFGVGGGFIIVPALTLITLLNIHRAVASSLFIISMIGISGFSAALIQGRQIDPGITGLFIIGGVVGMFGGRLLASRISTTGLQTVFAILIIVVAVLTLFTPV